MKAGAAGMAAAATHVPLQALGGALLTDCRGVARALFDERFEDGRSFGAALAARGIPVRGIRGDVAQLWYGDLKPRLVEERLPFVGLTDRAALFCLEELARDLGMKVRGRIDHTIDGVGKVSHRCTGPTGWFDVGHRLGDTPGFGTAMAALLTDPARHGGVVAAQKRAGPFSTFGSTSLVSWWIG